MIFEVKIILKKCKKPVDNVKFVMYNKQCVSDEMPSNCIRNYEFGVRRSTQEAEEVPLLRV